MRSWHANDPCPRHCCRFSLGTRALTYYRGSAGQPLRSGLAAVLPAKGVGPTDSRQRPVDQGEGGSGLEVI
jgi:hypothetical protein